MEDSKFDKIVHLEKAGTLKNFISEKEMMSLWSLKITGEINGADFDEVLDEMCSATGVYDDDDIFNPDYEFCPKLRILDMGECTFVGGKTLPYFGYHTLLQTLIFPQGIENLCTEDETGFSESENLEFVVLPEGLKKIEGFECCPKLKRINIPSSVEEIGTFAFSGDSIEEIFIPKGVNKITGASFGDCPIKKFVLEEGNPYLKELDGVIFSYDMKTIMAFPKCFHSRTYVIPSGVEIIGDLSFADSDIDEVIIPDSVTTIEGWAFQGSHIKRLNIPDSVTTIGELAFRWCEELETIRLPKYLQAIERQVFSGCSKIKTLDIPGSIKTLHYSSIAWSENLEHIILHDGLEHIDGDGWLLLGKGNLKELRLPKTLQSLPGGAFHHCTQIKNFEVDPENPFLCAFEGAIYTKDMKKLIAVPDCSRTEFVVPEGVEELNDYVFADFTRLKSVTLPHSLMKIGERVFDSCESLTEVYIHENVKEIHYRAFDNCSSLTAIRVGAKTPPEVYGDSSHWTFTPKPKNVTLFVPKGTTPLFKEAHLWNKFGKIIEE